MLRVLKARFLQGHRTIGFPKAEPVLPDRFRGLPVLDASKCPPDCHACVEACPTKAISQDKDKLQVDLGRCLFCVDCRRACPSGAVEFTEDYRLATRRREDLVVDGRPVAREDPVASGLRAGRLALGQENASGGELKLAKALDDQSRRLFGRSLKLRQVSAGGCSACEADLNVLSTVVFDLGRFGIQFVAAPRHADAVVITGPVTANMKEALLKTYEAIPAPKLVIAVGACAISGGPYIDHAHCTNGAPATLPVDLFIPGCPPHPITILDGLLRLLGRIK
jgi:Ni,Fe-hydrogenase III small subunit/formate hydrogenlyase subunit 6/NADH:ubiquinone oxidoreductase subunit I